jgi:predicted acyl esterase
MPVSSAIDDDAPGLGDAAEHLWRIAFPTVRVTPPPPGIRFERDVPIQLRDGVAVRANVFRPEQGGRFPVLMCAHPYGKNALPARGPLGYLPPKRYRFMRQPEPVTFSAYTTWEAPDPGYWVPRGYAVVNLDLRGFGTSEGIGSLLSDQEARDYAEAIEWAAAQPWSSGKVGLNGVSYLAISQWRVAALRPPHLAAMCPWEGWTDAYRDLAYPGGVREDGFLRFWAPMTEREGHVDISLRDAQVAHPDWDDFWRARVPDLERIEVPALICASFSDHGLHSRGAFEGFRRIRSNQRFLYTHRGGKWSVYYSPEALALQTRFFDCFLKGEDNGMRAAAPVRLEVRERGDSAQAVREARSWPLAGTRWTRLYLTPGVLQEKQPETTATMRFELPAGGASFRFEAPEDLELAGPMVLRLKLELTGTTDANLFAAVRKLRGDQHFPFEGSSGFGHDVVTKGWLRVAHRRIDPTRSEPHRPVLPCERPEPLPAGQIASLDIELLPSATLFRRGDTLRVDLQGHWFWRRSAFFGMFPFDYAPSSPGTAILHFGGPDAAHLLVPRTD